MNKDVLIALVGDNETKSSFYVERLDDPGRHSRGPRFKSYYHLDQWSDCKPVADDGGCPVEVRWIAAHSLRACSSLAVSWSVTSHPCGACSILLFRYTPPPAFPRPSGDRASSACHGRWRARRYGVCDSCGFDIRRIDDPPIKVLELRRFAGKEANDPAVPAHGGTRWLRRVCREGAPIVASVGATSQIVSKPRYHVDRRCAQIGTPSAKRHNALGAQSETTVAGAKAREPRAATVLRSPQRLERGRGT
jgi:hypothetical protein